MINEEIPKEEDVTLPGWGSWSGPGVQASVKKVVVPPKPGSGIESSKRKDAKLKNVIINEKRQKNVSFVNVVHQIYDAASPTWV